jgi:hypothetical protein
MADEKDDAIKANIYAERPGNTVKPTIVTEPLPAEEDVDKETKEKLTEQRQEDKENEIKKNDTSGIAG